MNQRKFSNTEAENAVIGAVLLDCTHFCEVASFLFPDDFYSPFFKQVYSAMIALQSGKVTIDLATVNDQLSLAGIDGKLAELAELCRNTPSSKNIMHYAEIVKRYSNYRKIRDLLVNAAGKMQDADQSVQEIMSNVQLALTAVSTGSNQTPYLTAKEVLKETINRLNAKNEGLVGLTTNIKELDSITGGFRPGQLIVLAGRPGMGKSMLATNMAANLALRHKKNVMLFTLEMQPEEIMTRIISSECPINHSQLVRCDLSVEQWGLVTSATEKLMQSSLFMAYQPNISLPYLRSVVLKAAHDNGRLDFVVIDYLQLFNLSGYGKKNTNEAIGQITKELKQLAAELKIPILLLSQLNREIERRAVKHPLLSDLRDSGNIEQDADIILFVDRPSEYDQSIGSTDAFLWVAKNRSGAAGKKISLKFFGEVCTFGEPS